MFPDIIPSGTKLAHSYDNKANPKGITSMSTSPQAKKYPFGTRVERKTMRRHEVIKTTLRELIIAICDRAAKRSDINPQLSDRFSQKDNNDVKQVLFGIVILAINKVCYRPKTNIRAGRVGAMGLRLYFLTLPVDDPRQADDPLNSSKDNR